MISLKKIWSFLKNYWYIPLVAVASTLGYLLAKKDKIPVNEILAASKKTHDVEKKAIIQASEQKKLAKAKVEEEYHDAVNAINNLKKFENEELDAKKKKEIKKIVKKHYNEPEQISKDISDLFGIKYVPKNRNNSD
jgi:hypothetical protein